MPSLFVTASATQCAAVDILKVLLWGDTPQLEQALRQLRELDNDAKPFKWVKNHAFDGRRENRQDLKAREDEQATRVQLFAEAREHPFEASISPSRLVSATFSRLVVLLHLARK